MSVGAEIYEYILLKIHCLPLLAEHALEIKDIHFFSSVSVLVEHSNSVVNGGRLQIKLIHIKIYYSFPSSSSPIHNAVRKKTYSSYRILDYKEVDV